MADLGIKNNRVVYLDANGNTVYKLPTADGSANQVLATDGGGNLVFATVTAEGVDAGNSGGLTTTATTTVTLNTFAHASIRGGRYTVVLADATSGEYQVTEIHIIHDGTNVNISQFGTVFAGGSTELATFSADISGSDVRLRVTPASANSTVIKWERSLQSA
tara:strand:+ start:373 stop:858 length:486 start_codon:yes stop_codon:yes gene_type:complete